MTREAFENTCYTRWMSHRGLDVRLLNDSGTTLRVRPEWKSTKTLQFWYVLDHTIIETPPPYQRDLQAYIDNMPAKHGITATEWMHTTGITGVTVESGRITTLYPPDFTPVYPPHGFRVRNLNAGDAIALTTMQTACSEADRQEAAVGIDNAVVTGVFDDNQYLVSAASMFELGGFADIGVITHPDYRGKGLGRAAVSFLVEQIIGANQIAQYRHNIQNVGSARVAEVLGFRKIILNDGLWLP